MTPQQAPPAVEELKRAWRAVQNGQFRNLEPGSGAATAPGCEPDSNLPPLPWVPAPAERVVPVVGCAGSCGATTVAVALAEASPNRSRVVECGSAGTSGLVAASTAELGPGAAGWTMGRRGDVRLDRIDRVLSGPAQVPRPAPCEPGVGLTVLDVGWPLERLLATPCWLTDQMIHASPLILCTTCTGPGIRRLEAALELLSDRPVAAAVIGPPRKKWPTDVRPSIGPRTRRLDRDGHLVVVPEDRRLRTVGLSPAPLPPPVLAAGAALRELALHHHLKEGTER